MAHFWTPQSVIGRVRPFNDYPCITFNVPAFSRRAVDALRDFLEPNGELLPLLTSVGEYYAYNVTTVADILNHEWATVRWFDDKQDIALSIDHFELHESRLDNLSIFRIVEDPVATFVTNRFAERVREHKLEGFDFIKIWPLPRDVNWMTPWKYPKLTDPLTLPPPEPGGQPIKGNTVVIRLRLSGETATPAEKERIAMIEDELDAMLVNPRKNAAYYGSLEGDDYVPGECRLFFTCPDADKLARKLKPWLKKLDWSGQKFMLKRYGEYVDVSATEEYVDIS